MSRVEVEAEPFLPEWLVAMFESSAGRQVLRAMNVAPSILRDMAYCFEATAIMEIRKMANGDVDANPFPDTFSTLALAVTCVVASCAPTCRAIRVAVGEDAILNAVCAAIPKVIASRKERGMAPLTHITLILPRPFKPGTWRAQPSLLFYALICESFSHIAIDAYDSPDAFGASGVSRQILRAAHTLIIRYVSERWVEILRSHPNLESLSIVNPFASNDADPLINAASTIKTLRKVNVWRWTPACTTLRNLVAFGISGPTSIGNAPPTLPLCSSSLRLFHANELPVSLPPGVGSWKCKILVPSQIPDFSSLLRTLSRLESLHLFARSNECRQPVVDAVASVAPTLRQLTMDCLFSPSLPPIPPLPQLEELTLEEHMRIEDCSYILRTAATSPLSKLHILAKNAVTAHLPHLAEVVCGLSRTIEDVRVYKPLTREEVVRILRRCERLTSLSYVMRDHNCLDIEDEVAAHPCLTNLTGMEFMLFNDNALSARTKMRQSNRVWRKREQWRRHLAAWKVVMALILSHRSHLPSPFTPRPPIERVPWHFASIQRTVEDFIGVQWLGKDGDAWIMIR